MANFGKGMDRVHVNRVQGIYFGIVISDMYFYPMNKDVIVSLIFIYLIFVYTFCLCIFKAPTSGLGNLNAFY